MKKFFVQYGGYRLEQQGQQYDESWGVGPGAPVLGPSPIVWLPPCADRSCVPGICVRWHRE